MPEAASGCPFRVNHRQVALALSAIEPAPYRYAVVLIITISLGATLEWHQTNVPGRYGTLSDVLLNILGIIVGLIAAFFLL